jgi:hypothetical protein
LSLSVYSEGGELLADDAATKALLDTDDNGVLNDADGDGMGLDVSFDGSRLTIRVENDAIVLSNFSAPVDFLLI